MNKPSADAKKSCAVFSVTGEDYDQVSVWLSLFEALNFLNEVRGMNPYGEYVLLFRVDA